MSGEGPNIGELYAGMAEVAAEAAAAAPTAEADATAKADAALAAANTYTDTQLGDYQPTLVSGSNIKTINGEAVLGSGDLVVTSAPSVVPEIPGTLTAGYTMSDGGRALIAGPFDTGSFTLDIPPTAVLQIL